HIGVMIGRADADQPGEGDVRLGQFLVLALWTATVGVSVPAEMGDLVAIRVQHADAEAAQVRVPDAAEEIHVEACVLTVAVKNLYVADSQADPLRSRNLGR